MITKSVTVQSGGREENPIILEDDDDVIYLEANPKSTPVDLEVEEANDGIEYLGYFGDLAHRSECETCENNRETPFNNATGSPSSVRYFRNPCSVPFSKASIKNENDEQQPSTSSSLKKQSNILNLTIPTYPSNQQNSSCGIEIIGTSSIKSSSTSSIPFRKDSNDSSSTNFFFRAPATPQESSASFPLSATPSTSNSFGFRKRKSSTESANFTDTTSEHDTIRPPSYLPANSNFSSGYATPRPNFENFDFQRGQKFTTRKKHAPRVPGSVDVFISHTDKNRCVNLKDLEMLNKYLGQCMFEEADSTNFYMGFEYKKITAGQAQFNCPNKQLADWTLDKIEKFREAPMKGSLRNARQRVNAFMWMNNLPHLGDAQPDMEDVIRGLAKCNPGFSPDFKITVDNARMQNRKFGRFFFQIVADEGLLDFLRSKIEFSFRVCVLKYFNVKVFFRERC